MAEFTLDTSGAVFIPDPCFPSGATRIRWSDLSPFSLGDDGKVHLTEASQ